MPKEFNYKSVERGEKEEIVYKLLHVYYNTKTHDEFIKESVDIISDEKLVSICWHSFDAIVDLGKAVYCPDCGEYYGRNEMKKCPFCEQLFCDECMTNHSQNCGKQD